MTLAGGTRLGPYEIVGLLGAGGMGEVYRARDSRLRRDVAIKVLPERVGTDADARQRFEREARAVAALSHPNILGIFDYGSDGGVWYAAMELLEGESLRDRLSGAPLPRRKAVDFALQIAQGLAAAHEKGIVHRDIKPENIFVTNDGRVKVLDFGLARTLPAAEAGDSRSPTADLGTEPGVVLGTIGYMAPEQVRGEVVDHRADIFAFGAVLYEMLAGRRAFSRDTAAETMTAILREDPPELPPPLAGDSALKAILGHCLEKSPGERFQSARDIAFDLRRLADAGASGRGRSAPSSRPRRRTAAPAAMLAAALGAGAVAGYLLRRPPPPQPASLRVLTYSGRDRAPAVSPDRRTIAFTSVRDGTQKIWLKQLASGAEAALTSGPDDVARFSPDGSSLLFAHNEGWSRAAIYRISAVGGDPRKLLDADEADWSPDGTRLCWIRVQTGDVTSSTIGVAEASGTNPRVLARLSNVVLATPRWSPGSRFVTVCDTSPGNRLGKIDVVDISSGKIRPLDMEDARGVLGAPIFDGNRTLLYAEAESAVGAFAGSATRVFRRGMGDARGVPLLWSPGAISVLDVLGAGKLIFDSLTVRSSLEEKSLSPGPSSRWLTRGSSNDRQPRYSPDGESIVFSSNRGGSLDLWSLATRTGAIRRITESSGENWDPSFTADGKKLVWSSNRSGTFEIWMSDADGTAAGPVTRNAIDAENPVPTPDGKWILYVSYAPGKFGIWKVHPDGSGAAPIVSGSAEWPEVSPDGLWVSYALHEGVTLIGNQAANRGMPGMSRLRVARIDDGRVSKFASDGRNVGGWVGRARWMPDGKSIAYVGADDRDRLGIYAQEFRPDADTSASRRPLAGFDGDVPAETFALSPDGRRIVLSVREQSSAIVEADDVAGVEGLRRPR